MVIDPDRFKNSDDGPCHTPELRKRFWTDVLKSLELSYDLLFAQARAEDAKQNRAKHPAPSRDASLNLFAFHPFDCA
jgi:hypothetical protein